MSDQEEYFTRFSYDELVTECARLRSLVPGPDSLVFDGDWLEHNMQKVFRGQRELTDLYTEIRPSWYDHRPLPAVTLVPAVVIPDTTQGDTP